MTGRTVRPSRTLGVFIPGRLSSERLPNKLILPIGESCLFDIACQKLARLPEDIGKYALVYDEELIEIAERYPEITVIRRSRISAWSEGPLKFIFEYMKDVPEDYLMFLNPCLLFLRAETILEKIREFQRSRADYATSVKPFQNWLFDAHGFALNEVDYKALTTKTIVPVHQAAHCFHIFPRKKFFKDGFMLKDGLLPLSVPCEETIDVDTPQDYEFARWKYEKEICR